ncbi:MAG: fasciclin domain-containing protein [Deltaproteobacteria bacterium]|nr:fasciclin domain-containing protein [Deltaproteobacteria bacterium]
MKRMTLLAVLLIAACGSSDKPSPTATTTPPATITQAPPAASEDIVDTAVAAGSFKTLVTAVQTAGLVETLKGPGPFTVFAPTDEAFAKLPAGALDALLADKAKLATVLTYHVVAGNVTSGAVAGMTEATTVQGGKLKIDAASGVKVNNATVVKADVTASNGVIHVIDTVLLPPQ